MLQGQENLLGLELLASRQHSQASLRSGTLQIMVKNLLSKLIRGTGQAHTSMDCSAGIWGEANSLAGCDPLLLMSLFPLGPTMATLTPCRLICLQGEVAEEACWTQCLHDPAAPSLPACPCSLCRRVILRQGLQTGTRAQRAQKPAWQGAQPIDRSLVQHLPGWPDPAKRAQLSSSFSLCSERASKQGDHRACASHVGLCMIFGARPICTRQGG